MRTTEVVTYVRALAIRSHGRSLCNASFPPTSGAKVIFPHSLWKRTVKKKADMRKEGNKKSLGTPGRREEHQKSITSVVDRSGRLSTEAPAMTSSAESQNLQPSQRFVYTNEEREVLRELVKKHAKVIENKRTNSSSVDAKNKAWENLCVDYNSQPNMRPRNPKQLRKLWDKEKTRWKETDSHEKRDLYATGGGFRTCRPMSPSLELVGAVASHMSVRVPNPYNSDGAHRGEPVLLLPPAAMFDTMMDPDHDWTDMPATEECYAPQPPQPQKAAPQFMNNTRLHLPVQNVGRFLNVQQSYAMIVEAIYCDVRLFDAN